MIDPVLITGGTGAFGQAFTKRLLSEESWKACKKIAILSRGEFRQFVMSQELGKMDASKRLRFFIGDVRDKERLVRAMDGMKVVIHAAALKRIEVGFYNPIEMVKTNVLGTMNVIEAALDAGVEKVVFLSSDKAFQPISPYGHTKALAEALVLASNNISGGRTRFAVTRYGNVWRSTGSVVPVWEEMIKNGAKKVPITDPDCTRFFMRMDEAIDLVLKAIEEMPDKPLIPKLPAYRLGDLATAMNIDMTEREILGLPSWEKMHESMSEGNSSDKARRMSVEELREALHE